jgi:phosphatidylserine/phosphatidylglycerophosphate/cardiolipin synthase-like enzyme
MGLGISSCGTPGGDSKSAPAISYEVWTTTGGDSVFPTDTMGAINQGLLDLIGRSTDSSQIHIAIFDWTILEFADAIETAMRQNPHLGVFLIVDPNNYASPKPARKQLRKRLKALQTSFPNRFHLENDQNPNAGLLHTSEFSPRRRMHNKFFLFRNLSPSRDKDGKPMAGGFTLALSSANLTYTEAGESNEMVVIHGDSGLYNRYLSYWRAMAVSQPDYSFHTTHTYSKSHDHFAYFFPKSVPGDEVANILKTLEEGMVQTRQPAKVRIAMSIWHRCRKELASLLVRMQKKQELDVRVLLKVDLDIALEVKQILDSLPQGSVRWLPSRNPALDYGLHSKLMLLEGPFALKPGGEPQREHLTFTGSHNWNQDAHRFNSETWIRIADKSVHAQLEAHWQELWDKGIDSVGIYEEVIYDSTGCE